MHKKKTSDIRLYSGGSTGAAGWLIQMAVSLLALAAEILIFTELTGYHQASILAAAGAYICVFYGFLTKFQKQTWFYPIVLLVLLAVCLIFRQTLLAGYCNFRSQLSDTITLRTGCVLPELVLPEADENTATVLFSLMWGSAMGLMACCFAPGILAPCLPVVAVAGMVLLGYTASSGWLLTVLAISAVLLLCTSRKEKPAFAPVLCSWGIWAAIFCLLLLCISGLDDWGEEIGSRVQQSLHRHRYETEYTVLPEGNLSGTPTESEDIQPGLVVTMSHGEEMYLRGFAGCTFEGNCWLPISNQSLYEEKQLLYWLNKSGFPLNAQFEAASASLGLETGWVTVENIGGCSAYLYVPYTLCDGAYLTAENLNLDAAAGDGSRSYGYRVVSGGGEALSRVLENLQDTGDSEYLQAEKAYYSFVYDHYLSVPGDVEALLGDSWDALSAEYGAVLTSGQAQSCILAFLNNIPEDLLLPDQAGSSYQYATLAVLTARHFGIPARYAEGYMISEEMAQENVPISVDSSCAGAWAEVYQQGIGWIPMDLTPGLEGATQQTTQKPQQSPETPQEQEEETPGQSPDGAQTPEGRALASAENILLLLCLILLLIVVILICRHQYHRKKINEKFRLESPREAVGWIFADTARLLESMGLDRKNGSMRSLCQAAGERFGTDYEKALTYNLDINDLALFSSRELTQEHRQALLAFRLETLGKLRKEIKWYRRLWLKWFRCLY